MAAQNKDYIFLSPLQLGLALLLNFDPSVDGRSIVFWRLGNFLQGSWCVTSSSSSFGCSCILLAWDVSMVARALVILLVKMDNQGYAWEGGSVCWLYSINYNRLSSAACDRLSVHQLVRSQDSSNSVVSTFSCFIRFNGLINPPDLRPALEIRSYIFDWLKRLYTLTVPILLDGELTNFFLWKG